MDKPFLPRLPGDEFVDEIRIKTIPRFKNSRLSGSEWRTSIHVTAYRKGRVVGEETWSTLKNALPRLYGWIIQDDLLTINPDLDVDMTNDLCMQPGCSNPYAVDYRMTARGCGHCGHENHREATDTVPHRRFCIEHRSRGDNDPDDNDGIYRMAVDLRDDSLSGTVLCRRDRQHASAHHRPG